jgi:hypothetical protein
MVLFPDHWDLAVQRFNEANANKLFKKQGVSKFNLNDFLTLCQPQDQKDFLISTIPEVDKLTTFSYSSKAKILTFSGEQNEVSLKTAQKLVNLQEQPEGCLRHHQTWSSDPSLCVPTLLESQDLLNIKKIDPLYKLKNYDVDQDFYPWVKSFPLTSADLLEEETLGQELVFFSKRIGISSHLRLANQKPLGAICHAPKQWVVQKKFNFFDTQTNEINLPWDPPSIPQIDLLNFSQSFYAYAIYWQSGELLAVHLVASCGLTITQTGISIWLYGIAKKGFCIFISYPIKYYCKVTNNMNFYTKILHDGALVEQGFSYASFGYVLYLNWQGVLLLQLFVALMKKVIKTWDDTPNYNKALANKYQSITLEMDMGTVDLLKFFP